MKRLKTRYWNRRQLRRPRRKRSPRRPTIRFSPTSWAKLLFLRDLGPTEVGGFGITAADDLLFVQEIELVRQHCTETFVAFDDTAVAEYFEYQVDLGRRPEQFGRIWIHTHPGSSPEPSPTDLRTFDRVFGSCDWAVMFILARGGQTSAELSWRQGGHAPVRLDVEVDYSQPFIGSDHEAWAAEYAAAVQDESWHRRQDFADHQTADHSQKPLDAEYADLFADPFPVPSSLNHSTLHSLESK